MKQPILNSHQKVSSKGQTRSLKISTTKWGDLIFLSCLLTLAPQSAMAQIDFNFDFSAAPHFNADSIASLESAASRVESLFSPYNATIEIKVSSVSEDNSFLAAAGSAFPSAGSVGFSNQGIIATKILTQGASDPNGAAFDGEVDVNFYHTWDYDDDIAPGSFDFQSTLMHELLHTVGFSSSISEEGNDAYGTEPDDPGIWTPFDEFVADSKVRIIGANGVLDEDDWLLASTDGTGSTPPSDGLYFAGPFALAANGGHPIPLYSPEVWESGSSGSHLDDNFFTGNQALLMNAATGTGPGIRNISPIEIAILKDIGFTAVPEPSTWATVASIGIGIWLIIRRYKDSHPMNCPDEQ